MARKRAKRAKKGAFRVVSAAVGLKKSGKGKGRLKKGCKWGRGKNKGKILCRK